MMVKGCIFDYGGTIDTRGCHWGKKIWHAYENAQVPVNETSFRDAYVYAERTLGKNPIIKSSFTFKQTLDAKLHLQMEYLDSHLLFSKPVKTEEMTHTLLHNLYQSVCETVKESREVLTELAKVYPLVLVSNFYGNIEVVLHEFDLAHLFGCVIESAVVGVRKPDPRIFTLGVEALGMEPAEVVVVGDSFTKDILAAQKAGCKTIWIKGEGWTDDSYDENVPDRVIKSLNELIPGLLGV